LNGNVEDGDFGDEGEETCDVLGVFVNLLGLMKLEAKETQIVRKNFTVLS
jgi:hypothetical protein